MFYLARHGMVLDIRNTILLYIFYLSITLNMKHKHMKMLWKQHAAYRHKVHASEIITIIFTLSATIL